MSEVPEKRVLAQDLPQYIQSTQRRTVAQQREAEAQYQREVAEIEKENLSEQQRYERELEAYKKATQKQREADALKVEYDAEIRKLEEEKADAIARAHSSVWGPGGSKNRSDLNTKLDKIERKYNSQINKVREQKRVTSGVAEYYLQNPESKLDTSVLRRFQETGSSFNLGILQSQKDVAREARTEYSRQAGVTTARSEAGKIQSAMAEIGTTQGSYGLGEGSERAAVIKSTPDTTAGKKAVESRRPLINVKTVENIYGGQQIETNPRAFVASLTRQEVTASGKPIPPKVETPITFSPVIPSEPKMNNERWQVEIDGKIRTFKTKEAAQEYIQRRTPAQIFGPQFQKQESVYLPAGTLQYLVETKQLQPDPKKFLTIKSDFSKTPQGPEKPRPLESAIQFFGDVGKKYKDIQPIAFTAGAIEEGLGMVGGTINLIEKGRQKLGEYAPVKYPIKEVKKPYALPTSPFDYPVEIGVGTVFDKMPVTQAERQARERQIQIMKEEGGYRYSGKLSVAVMTLPIKGTIRTGERAVTALLKPARKEATAFLQRRTASMLEVGKKTKPFSYDIPYKPTKRANEIDVSDFGERIGPATMVSKRPVAARQSDVIIPRKEKPVPVKEDITYKPARRANEIDISRDNVLVEFRTQKVKLGRASAIIPEKPVRGKIIEPVKPDIMYRPARRANEIDISRDTASTRFRTTKVKLGRGAIQPTRYEVRGKEVKPVEPEFFYKPAKRANEIDVSDFGEKIKTPKIEMKKSEVSLDLKRELKRLKRTQPEFKTEKVELGGEGIYISGKRQSLVLIKKQEQLTQKKLLTKRKTPLGINWSEQVEKAQVPKTGRSPIQVLVPREKKKKKAYLQEQTSSIQAYEIPVSEQRPKTKTVPKMEIRSEFKLSTPQRIQESVKFETVQPQKLAQRPKAISRQRYKSFEVFAPRQIEKPQTRQRQKVTQPEPFKFPSPQPVRLAQPAKLKQPTPQTFRYREPEMKPPKRAMAALLPGEGKIPKSVLKKEKEKADFLGASSELQIGGLFKRADITYGQRKISKLLKGDVRVVQGKPRSTRRSKEQKDMLGFSKKKKNKTSFW